MSLAYFEISYFPVDRSQYFFVILVGLHLPVLAVILLPYITFIELLPHVSLCVR